MSAESIERFLSDPLAYVHASWFPEALSLPPPPWSATVRRLVNAWLVSTYCPAPVQQSGIPEAMTWIGQPAEVLGNAALKLGLRIRKREYLQVIDRLRMHCLEQAFEWRASAGAVEEFAEGLFKLERTPSYAWQEPSTLREYVRSTGVAIMLGACAEHADLKDRLQLKFDRTLRLPEIFRSPHHHALQEMISGLIQDEPTVSDSE